MKKEKKMLKIANKLEYWQISNKKEMILSSYIIMPVNLLYLMFRQVFPDIPTIFKQYILLFLTLPLLVHYYYFNFSYDPNEKQSFIKRVWKKVRNTPKSFWIILFVFLYTAFSTNINKLTELTLFAFFSMIISFHIAKQILKIKTNIQQLLSDKDKFKMYMQLINKVLLAIITLIASILSIFLTIKQLSS